ncbi:transcriptional regulator [Cohnella sp. CIP 111063]|jgi:ABC-type multidrug transport system, ATPase component|uniref:LytTR family transcriptional regulator DNA-binding domain-containing protein n=1 Tax=unclassified Cohnella TaxID=2636738 RepID=UPI000B8C3A63|nr:MULTISPECIES: LytTR family transcriptional regulator DNA-binding domain-containing protein [unclassified Cohnella]OXS56959.1 transcriptional regulator [Cohnella sp. CIP 111063]PRX69807.1 LytTR family transcriptional regulator [Cohnella sp. SGD-V74]
MAVLTIDHLIKRKGNALLLPEINLQIMSGQCVVIQCNNELGQLLIQLLLGDIPTSGGHVLMDGASLPQNFKKEAHKIGVSLLNDGLYERLTVKDSLSFYKNLYQATLSINEVLHRIGLGDKLNSQIASLTFSEQKRLHLGRTIIHNPALLIWEEPEQNVDIESQIIIRALLTELLNEGKAILITTSYLVDAITITNEVYRLNEHEFKKLDVIDDSGTDAQTDVTAPGEEHPSQTALLPPAAIEVRPVRVEKIPAKVDDKIILFDPTEINFIESSEGISLLHVKGAHFPCVFTLNDLEIKLKAFGFFRCHRSYIVNLQKVREVISWTRNSYSLILDDDKKSSIPLSKGKYEELKGTLGI